jgi:hypothetical protein
MQLKAARVLIHHVTCQKANVSQGWWKRKMTKRKLRRRFCSVNFLVVYTVVKLDLLCYITWWSLILFGVCCTRPATIPCSKLFVSDSLQGSSWRTSQAGNNDFTSLQETVRSRHHKQRKDRSILNAKVKTKVLYPCRHSGIEILSSSLIDDTHCVVDLGYYRQTVGCTLSPFIVFPVLHQTPCHEGIRVSGSIAPSTSISD